MMSNQVSYPEVEQQADSISRLQGDAWAAWNASYGAPDADLYRTVGSDLYRQDVRERITVLFARSDEQNALIDAALSRQTRS
jgi:squalene cyclase